MSAGATGAAVGIAAAAESRARDAECRVVVGQYQSQGASVYEAREYAKCVDRLYPDPMTPAEIGAIKILIVLCLAGAVFGGFRGFGLEDRLMNSLGFGVLLPLGAAALVAALYGIAFVLGVTP